MEKILRTILDILLLTGAVVCVLTIDGGKWIISNPAFYQAYMEEYQYTVPLPEVAGETVGQAAPAADVVPPACLAAPALASHYWDRAYLILSAYQESAREAGGAVVRALVCR